MEALRHRQKDLQHEHFHCILHQNEVHKYAGGRHFKILQPNAQLKARMLEVFARCEGVLQRFGLNLNAQDFAWIGAFEGVIDEAIGQPPRRKDPDALLALFDEAIEIYYAVFLQELQMLATILG